MMIFNSANKNFSPLLSRQSTAEVHVGSLTWIYNWPMLCFWALNKANGQVQQKRSTILCLSYFYDLHSPNPTGVIYPLTPEGQGGQGQDKDLDFNTYVFVHPFFPWWRKKQFFSLWCGGFNPPPPPTLVRLQKLFFVCLPNIAVDSIFIFSLQQLRQYKHAGYTLFSIKLIKFVYYYTTTTTKIKTNIMLRVYY